MRQNAESRIRRTPLERTEYAIIVSTLLLMVVVTVQPLLDPEAAGALVARAGAALAPGGLLAVQEVLGDASPQGPAFGVMMLVSTPAGEAYAEADLRRWMAAAGCPVDRVVALEEGWHHLLLGRRR